MLVFYASYSSDWYHNCYILSCFDIWVIQQDEVSTSLMGEITTHINRSCQNYRNYKYVLIFNSDNQVHLLKFLFVGYSLNKIIVLLSQQTGIDYFLIV